MDKFTEYKERLKTHSEYILALRKDIHRIINQRELSSVMNDTKWLELQREVESLPFYPPLIVKCLTAPDDYPIGELVDAPRYLGDWSSFWQEGLPPFINIEWIRVRPRHGKYRGRLVPDEILDETEEFLSIMDKLSIPYEEDSEDSGTFIIYGYR